MKRGLMIGGGTVAAIAIVVIAIFIFVIANVDGIVRAGVEDYGSEATKAKVSLADVDISTSGKGALGGLVVGNPAGFKTEAAFKLGAIKVDLDRDSLLGDTIRIREIVIDKPQVVYELGERGSNIDAIKRNVNAFAGAEKRTAASSGKGGDAGPKIVIDNLYIRGGAVSVSASFLQGRKLTSPLPTIHLKDIGKKGGKADGATPGEVMEKIMASVGKGAGSAVKSLDLGGLMKKAGKGTEAAQKLITSGAGDAGSAAEKGVKEAEGALKKLFGQ